MNKRCEDCKYLFESEGAKETIRICDLEMMTVADARANGWFMSLLFHLCGKTGRKWEAK